MMVDSDVFSVSPVLDLHGESLRCRNVPAGTKGLMMAIQSLWSSFSSVCGSDANSLVVSCMY